MRYTRADFEPLFEKCDKNKDHVVNAEELFQFLKGEKMNPEKARVMCYFQKFDLNRDGVLQREEFYQLLEYVFANDVI